MQEILDIATGAAKQAGEFIQLGANRRSTLNIEQKSLNDFVSDVDRGAEKIIRALVSEAFPEHAILGEEFGASNMQVSDYQWIIDPLDGTTNFLRGIPHYAVSIAVTFKSELFVGVVYDPAKDELFSAVKGQGARLNEQMIACSPSQSVAGSLLATGVPFSGELLTRIGLFTDAMTDLLQQQTSGIRRLGAAALDLAYVAAGRYDGFWESSLKPWDIAAGALIVQEAGGMVSDFNQAQDYLESGNIIASAAKMHMEMSEIIGAAYLPLRT